MARCIDCKSFPWKRDSDPSMLPAVQCVGEMGAQRWTKRSSVMERDCSYFSPDEELQVGDPLSTVAAPPVPSEEKPVQVPEEEAQIIDDVQNPEPEEQHEGAIELEELKKVVEEDDTDTDIENKTKKITRRESSRRRK